MYLDNALIHGFGGRFSVSNCIYDNIMETIKKNCSCDSLENCTSKSDQTSDCALQEFENPYDKYLQPKHYCKESCNDQVSKRLSTIRNFYNHQSNHPILVQFCRKKITSALFSFLSSKIKTM